MSNCWEEPLPTDILPPPGKPLEARQIDVLWTMFSGIAKHWELLEDEDDRSRKRGWDVEPAAQSLA